VMQSNGSDAWQTVFHLHVHVIPRYPGDPLRLPWDPSRPAAADPDEIRRAYMKD
jgi:histidine triad (HIT) family protein